MPPRPIPHALDAAGTPVVAAAAQGGVAYACPACDEPVQALHFQGGKALWVHQDFVATCPYTRGVEPEPPPHARAAAWLAGAVEAREDLAVARACGACGATRLQPLRAGGRVLRVRRDVDLGGGLLGDLGVHDEAGTLRAVIQLVEAAPIGPGARAALAGRPWIAVAVAQVLGPLAGGHRAALVPVEDHFNPWRCPACGHANRPPTTGPSS
ncbi:MAG: hypothetical protein VKQ33_00220 [Candidatus Sericytochromatia bacterium]|nr:hypothetical protein [Candidatus Sericytochromatia bacterium]